NPSPQYAAHDGDLHKRQFARCGIRTCLLRADGGCVQLADRFFKHRPDQCHRNNHILEAVESFTKFQGTKTVCRFTARNTYRSHEKSCAGQSLRCRVFIDGNEYRTVQLRDVRPLTSLVQHHPVDRQLDIPHLTDRYCELDCQRQSGSPPRTGKSALSRIVYTDNRYIDIVHSKCSDDHTRIIPVRLRILCKSLCSKRACRQECTEE